MLWPKAETLPKFVGKVNFGKRPRVNRRRLEPSTAL